MNAPKKLDTKNWSDPKNVKCMLNVWATINMPWSLCLSEVQAGYVKRLNVLQGFPPRRAIQNADVRNTANTEAYIANTDAY